MARFWYTNKEYAQMIYEHTGVWADRATYADDYSEYRLYYYEDKADVIMNKYDIICHMLQEAEGGRVSWSVDNNCLTLYAR